MTATNDTIAALSSAAGASARAIVRLSGPRSIEMAAGLLGAGREALLTAPGYSWFPARVRLDAPDSRPPGGWQPLEIDADLFVMRAPRSYTREDVVEFHLLGSRPLVSLLLARLFDQGARQAEPGEFTRRAYLSGRIGLLQAEGVARLIEARSEAARRAAIGRLEGRLEEELGALREAFARVLAVAEAYVDFTEEDTEALDEAALRSDLLEVESRLDRAERALEARPSDQDDVQIVLYGARNAGKSTLFSRLVPGLTTLVSPIPGTTRDLVEGQLRLGETEATLWDAPGVGEAADPLEAEAIDRLHHFLDRADLLLVLVDAASLGDPAEVAALDRRVRHRPRLVLLSRADRGVEPKAAALARELAEDGNPFLEVSARTGVGLDELRRRLTSRIAVLEEERGATPWGVDAGLASALRRARDAVRGAARSDLGLQIELAIFELREALQALAPWMGPIDEEDLLDRIFSRFCIGK